ncbi:uncharacterized protein N7473_009463 [Penicillium subrubescens]|uniref:uncharacterized protein n=1 Tax=Penicillium subrubescens TaxID=1316194 RepID=UPI0025452830|nr:uncharacterized protein N7473_009463 [Penicillium subrubescens]KAJ5886789.1 hypothetical protein N7473_009463 [Penicillium subrubescens]
MDMEWMLLYVPKEGNEKRVRYFLSKEADMNFQGKLKEGTPLCNALSSAPNPLGFSRRRSKHCPASKDPTGLETDSKYTTSARDAPGGYLAPEQGLAEVWADATKASPALFDAVKLEKPAEFRLLMAHNADTRVRLQGESLAQCVLESECESIKELGLEWDIKAKTRELARHVGTRCGNRRYRRPRGQHADETVSAQRNGVLQSATIDQE